jgi:hypothetical protein
VPELMEKYHVAGAVVGVTDSSRTLFQKGYGKADIALGPRRIQILFSFGPGLFPYCSAGRR